MRTAFALLFAASTAHAAITGTIITDDGKPVAGAAIQSFAAEDSRTLRARLLSKSPDRTTLATAQSGENGTFNIDPKAPLADIAISFGGRQIGLQLPDGEDAGIIVVPAHPSRRVRILGDGKPLANALVAAGPFTTRTDAAGVAELPEASPATIRVTVIHPEFAISEDPVAESPLTPVEFKLQKGSSVRGKVIGADGAPVGHAVVTIAGWPLAESDAAGNFTIAHARPGWRAVVATAGARAAVAMKKAGAPIEIHLGPGATLSGVVRDSASGRGIPAVRVHLMQQGEETSIITDAKGNFTLKPIIPGHYNVSGTHPAYAITPVTLDLQTTIAKPIEARPLPKISGRILDEQRHPVAGALVWLGSRGGIPHANAVVSGPDGAFTLRGNIAQFGQPIFALKSGYALGTVGPLSTDSIKSSLMITLPRGFPFEVKVVDKQRQPVPAAAVMLIAGSGSDSPFGRYSPACEEGLTTNCHATNASGSATYRVVEGRYDIQVRGETIATKALSNQNLTARSSPLTIEVDRGVEVSGRVAYRDGTPVSDVMVMTRNMMFGGSAERTNADGTFTLKGLAAGPVTIVARPTDDPINQGVSADVTAPAQNVAIVMPTPGRIEGRVVEKTTHQPITDFVISAAVRGRGFVGPNAQPPQFHSDDGTFVLDRVSLGSVELRASAAGYAPATLTDITVEEGKPVTGLEVQLERGAKLSGRVTANGQPLAGASVRSGSGSRQFPSFGFDPNSTTTDADGEYVINSIGAGERTIEFDKQGYLPKRKSVELTAGKDARLDMEMERGRDLTGRVIDSSGRPVAGARVSSPPGPGIPYLGNVFSDADGMFKLEGLADGHYTVTASKQGYVNATADAKVPSQENLTLTLGSGGTITGRVIGLSDAEMVNATVMASGPNGSARGQLEPGGTFTLHGVPDGRVGVSAMVIGTHPRQSAPKFVEVTNGSASPVDIDFSQGATITGHVTQSGTTVTQGNVNFAPKHGGSGASGQIGMDGTYEVSGLAPGDYNVFVFVFGGVNYQTQTTIGGSSTFDIDIRGATLHGRVIDAATGTPLADTTVYLAPSPEVRTAKNTVTDSEGKFVMEALPDAKLEVRASHDGYAAGSQSVVVVSGTAPDVEIRLDRGQEAIVRIVDAQSGSALNGYVSVTDGKKSVGGGSQGDDGMVRLWLAPGTYKANVSARNYILQTVNLVVPGPEMRVALTQGGTLAIMSRAGGHIRLTLVGMLKPTREMSLPPGFQRNFDALPAGRYTVELIDKDGVTVKQSYSVDVLAGQIARLNID